MLKYEADFILMGFEFPKLEGKNLERYFPLIENQILKVRKFQNSVKKASGRKEICIRRILWENAQRRGWFYFDQTVIRR